MKTVQSMNSGYSVEHKTSDGASGGVSGSGSGNLSPEKLGAMGIVDLRMTRPPRPSGGKGQGGGSQYTEEDLEDNPLLKQKMIQKTQFHELVNSYELQDEPPPPVKERRVNIAEKRAQKERELREKGASKESKDDSIINKGPTNGGNVDVAVSVAQSKAKADEKTNKGGKGKEKEKEKEEKKSDAQLKKEAKVPFQDITSDGIQRLRGMLEHFCKKEDGSFYDDINLRAYGIDSGQIITNGVVQELCTVQPSLTRLDMSQCNLISDVGLWSIARHCRHIRELLMTSCDSITNVGLRSISLACHEIVRLGFDHCHLLDDIGLTVIATGAWKLKHLHLQVSLSYI